MPSADDRFAADRRARLEHEPAPRRWWLAAVAAVVVVAIGVTVARSQPDGLGPSERQSAKAQADTAARQLGTTCAGWPREVLPSTSVEDQPGSVTFWGSREAFRLRNPGPEAVQLEVRAVDGKLGLVDGPGSLVDDRTWTVELPAAGTAGFTASCGTRSMTVAVTDPSGTGFTLGSGPAPSPIDLVKERVAE